MNTNPIETTKYDSPLLRENGELLLAWFLIQKEKPHKLHLRTMAIAIDEFRKMGPQSRAEIIECLDRLFAEFKRMLSQGMAVEESSIVRCPHGFASKGNCQRCRGAQ